MKNSAILVAAALMGLQATAAGLSFKGNTIPPVMVEPPSTTGLEALYVIDGTAGVTASYTAASASASVTWERYSNLGGGFAEAVASSRNGAVSSITLGADDMGYIITEDGRKSCFWIVNYANHPLTLSALDILPQDDCDRTALALTGQADPITYFSINGMATNLSRELMLSYNTLEYSDEAQSWMPKVMEETLAQASNTIHVTAPLCNTTFTLTGDRFLAAWGNPQSVVSPEMTATAVDAVTSATQDTSNDADNQQTVETALGGSGPVDITFTAAVTDAVVYKEWQMGTDPTFEVIDLRFPDLEVTRSFGDYGTTYVRFVAGDATGACSFTSSTYEVYIGESSLLCPNVFSPNGDGVNDEWKVSYKSIISFECSIFNRWGTEMARLTDPSQGWDGRYGGKLVPSGAYYYVIRATGADGKDYKLSGDINIINSTPVNDRMQ